MATYSSVLAWRIPGMGEPGGLLSMGLHRVGHDSSDLAAAANLWKQASSGQTRGYLDSQLPLRGTQLCVHATSIQTSLYHSLAVVVSDQEKCPPFWSSGSPGGHRGGAPAGTAGKSGKGPGASWIRDNQALGSSFFRPFPSPSDESGFKSLSAP